MLINFCRYELRHGKHSTDEGLMPETTGNLTQTLALLSTMNTFIKIIAGQGL